MFYRRCALCYPAQLKAALNIYALTVLNTNQSAYKPTKLTQRCSLKSHKKQTPQTQRKKNMKLPSLSDTSAATKTWKTEEHKSNVSNIISFNIQDVSKFYGTKPPWSLHFHWKWKPRNLLSLTPAQPQKPERHSYTKQISAISSFLIHRTYQNFMVRSHHGHFIFIENEIQEFSSRWYQHSR